MNKSYTLTTPDTHGTINGAFGCAFLYDSEYLSLKLNFGFSSCIWQQKQEKMLVVKPMTNADLFLGKSGSKPTFLLDYIKALLAAVKLYGRKHIPGFKV